MRTDINDIFFPGIIPARTFSLLICFLFFFTNFSRAQTAAEYQVKAVFLYNFTRFVEWPAAAFQSENSPFIIGILGPDPFGSALDEAVSGENAGTHAITVRRYKNVKEIENCQILFININDDAEVQSLLSALKDKNTLTVSDENNFARKGGIIEFFFENKKVRMQINSEAAKVAALSISSKLLRVAKVL